MNTFEYHQLLKYIYFEGYTDSYEDAEYLLEELNDDEYEELCENVFRGRDNEEYVYENVSGGRGRRASSRRAPIPQRVSDSEAREIRRNARKNPKPTASAPKDDSLEAMKLRFNAEKEAKKAKKPTTVPSRGVEGDEPVLRRKTPEGHGKRGASPVAVSKRRARLLSTGQDTTQLYTYSRTPTPESKERAKKIRAALKNRHKWGTPEAAKEEYVIDHLVSEGYTDDYDSALEIYEAMSDEWLDTILAEMPYQKNR